MKIKSFGFWTALAGALTLLVGAIGKCFGLSIDGSIVEEVVMSIAGVLVALGVVCMPKDIAKNGENEKFDNEENIENQDELSDIQVEDNSENNNHSDDKE